MILQDDDRKKLLKALELAPDDVLLRAVEDYMRQREDAERIWEAVRGFSGAKPAKLDIPMAPAPAMRAAAAAPADEGEDDNVEPPGDAPTRIGRDTRDAILTCCRKPKDLGDIAKFIKRKPDLAAGLCRLLWDRGELVYDGECYRAA
jgi:hypothetical protein